MALVVEQHEWQLEIFGTRVPPIPGRAPRMATADAFVLLLVVMALQATRKVLIYRKRKRTATGPFGWILFFQ